LTFQILDVATGKPAVFSPSNDGRWTRLEFSADGRTLLRANGSNLVGIDTATWTQKWEVEDPPRKLRFHLPKVENVPNLDNIMQLWADDPDFRAANSDHTRCVAKNGGHLNVLLDMKTGKVIAKLDRPDPGLENCNGFFSPRSKLYVMNDWNSRSDPDGNFRQINTIFAVPSGKRLCRLPSETSKQGWSFSADESRVASFDHGTGIIRVHNTTTGELIRQIGEANPKWEWVWATLALSPDGNMLAVWTADLRNVQIWDVRTGKNHCWLALKKIEKGHVAACLAWSPDNRVLAVGGLDNSVRLWEVASAQVRREFVGHLAQARILAFSPDGRLLVSGSEDTTLLIWQMLNDKKPRE
jgi:hypothetical protein